MKNRWWQVVNVAEGPYGLDSMPNRTWRMHEAEFRRMLQSTAHQRMVLVDTPDFVVRRSPLLGEEGIQIFYAVEG